ncbi:MAG: HD domain-containing protein [Telmatospirillum sp.]|nr:HD domain-containing protein [Telmatospirillum sp.]
MAFILEIDRMKSILRQNVPISEPHRRENDAEHSWHLAVMALLLAEHADEPVDVARVVSMVLIHDIVEIDAGDTFIYDDKAREDQEEREKKAADRLFGMLPADQCGHFRALWEEFEAGVTADARFARAVDRMQPVMLNVATNGLRWRDNKVSADQVVARNRVIGKSSKVLWDFVSGEIARMVREGHLPQSKT